jgi:hypothetical protein
MTEEGLGALGAGLSVVAGALQLVYVLTTRGAAGSGRKLLAVTSPFLVPLSLGLFYLAGLGLLVGIKELRKAYRETVAEEAATAGTHGDVAAVRAYSDSVAPDLSVRYETALLIDNSYLRDEALRKLAAVAAERGVRYFTIKAIESIDNNALRQMAIDSVMAITERHRSSMAKPGCTPLDSILPETVPRQPTEPSR